MMNSIKELYLLGQSIWLDNISRAMLTSGKLKEKIELGLRGMTSNPTIFDKSISASYDYDERITELSELGKTTFEIYDELTVTDVQDAADLFIPIYQESQGLDGYVSLEVSPKLAHKTKDTIKEAKRLYKKVNRPNVMFKIPATEGGFEATEELIALGININITLIFSLEQYIKTANAYLKGISRLIHNKGDVKKMRSVASVFVSRVDSVCDRMLDEMLNEEQDQQIRNRLLSLKGKAAVSNASLIYAKYRKILDSDEFRELKAKRANIQRVLWGSTSTKNPAYSDIKYVTELIGKDTVNTIPDNTFDAFLDHGKADEALTADATEAQRIVNAFRDLGIDINAVCAELLKDGVMAFENSFASLLNTIEQKKETLCKK